MYRDKSTFIKTGFANSGRSAGIGTEEDNYGEESLSKLGHYGARQYPNPVFRKDEEEREPEPVYTYNEKGEKILLEAREDK